MSAQEVMRNYFRGYSAELQARFQRIRQTVSDSDVKGSANETILTEFITSQFLGRPVARGASILDINGNMSDEMDVCVCNSFQPIEPSEGQLLIVEGVDFVIQVKAVLTKGEIKRSFKNAKSLKTLKRNIGGGVKLTSAIPVEGPDGSRWTQSPAYIVLAYTSELKLETAAQHCTDFSNETDWYNSPEAVFILDRGWLAGHNTNSDKVDWSVNHSKEDTLMEFVRMIRKLPTFTDYPGQPILSYFPNP